MDFAQMARYDRDRITRSMDIAALCAVLGIELDSSGMGFCPFHANENTPAFSTFVGDDDKPRFQCHGCGARGDVIDLVMLRESLDYNGALARCAELLDSGLPEPAPRDSTPADFTGTISSARALAAQDADPIQTLLAERHSPIAVPWLLEQFGLGVTPRGEILMPHYAAGADIPHAVKVRGKDKWSLKGSRLTELYGVHRDRGCKDVVIVEGESDTWLVAWLLRNERVDVLGLPRGVGSAVDPDWVHHLHGRRVCLLLDADDAGRAGLRRWTAALLTAVDLLTIAHLPEGTDPSDSPERVTTALREAVPVRRESAFAVRNQGGICYTREPAKAAVEAAQKKEEPPPAPTPLTDWTLDVLRRVEVEGERIYFDVRLPNGRAARISDADLRNGDTLTRWCNPLGLAWRGRGSDTQELLRLLEAEAVFVPRLRGVSLAGWHSGSFVLPDITLGSPALGYVAPAVDARWGDRLRLDNDAPLPSTTLPLVLVGLHRPDVMTPLLGWVAAAPLRSICAQFPTLGVMGSAGAGKTTLVSEVLKTFGFTDGTPQSIANTTPHGVWGQVSSTNSIPVWFDEYRFGARQDGLQALDQAIRDAWNGAASLRGGMGDNKSALVSFPALSPIIVTGESAFQETSHAERMVIVSLPHEGRSREHLEVLLDPAMDRRGFGVDYLNWLVWAHRQDMLPRPPAENDRMEQAVAVVRWGYELLTRYCKQRYASELPPFDETLIRDEQRALTDTPPILEALREFHNTTDGDSLVVWDEGENVCVRYGRLTRLVQAKTTIVLPGNDKAIRKWLVEMFPGATEMRDGSAGRYLVLPNAHTVVFG